MLTEHFALLKPIIKEYQKDNPDMSISIYKDSIDIRVGYIGGYKRKVIKAKIILEEDLEDTDRLFYDIKVGYFNNRITVTDAYCAMAVLMDILLDFTKVLNQHYKVVVPNEDKDTCQTAN